MPVGLAAPDSLAPVAGVRLSSGNAGLKPAAHDMLLIEMCETAIAAGVFTRNAYCAAPVTIAKSHLSETGNARALLINAGNANAGTGEEGYNNALALCRTVAQTLNISENSVLPFSTGVIGEQLPCEKMTPAVAGLAATLKADNWLAAAQAIMTTDIVAKGISDGCMVDGCGISVTGISKGSGMIHPDMATMLAFVATDAVVEESALNELLREIADRTFNCITVDGDTSTNDSCIFIASGVAENNALNPQHPDWQAFASMMERVALHLAHAIIRDGEGATRFVQVTVSGAASTADCKTIAYTVALSPLVKTALFAGDPNLGRILAAIGRSPVADIQMNRVSLHLGDLPVVINGEPSAEYDEPTAAQIMAADDVQIKITVGAGDSTATVWTTDLSYDYVRINAEYRS